MAGRKFMACIFVLAACAHAAGGQGPRPDDAGVRWDEVQVEFEGNRMFTGEQLQRLTRQCIAERAGERATFDAALLDRCLKKNVADFMRRSGYPLARVGDFERAEGWPGLRVKAAVEEGEFYRLGVVSIEGAEYFEAGQLREMLPLRKGDVADALAVSRWLDEHLRKLYADSGFIQYSADVEPLYKLKHGASEGVADLTVTVSEGRRFVVRRIKFERHGDMPYEVLRAALPLRDGEVFSEQKFKDGVRRLNGLGLFDEIDAERDSDFLADEETSELEITIRLSEKARPGRAS